jgi:L-fuconolactonase
MMAAMDKVGVEGEIFISCFSIYRYDASHAWKCNGPIPGRVAIVKPVDPDDPDVADVIANWKKTLGTVGIGTMLPKEAKCNPDDLGLDRVQRAVVRHDFPVNMSSAQSSSDGVGRSRSSACVWSHSSSRALLS